MFQPTKSTAMGEDQGPSTVVENDTAMFPGSSEGGGGHGKVQRPGRVQQNKCPGDDPGQGLQRWKGAPTQAYRQWHQQERRCRSRYSSGACCACPLSCTTRTRCRQAGRGRWGCEQRAPQPPAAIATPQQQQHQLHAMRAYYHASNGVCVCVCVCVCVGSAIRQQTGTAQGARMTLPG